MKTIKVLGSGCNKCKKTADIILSIADELGLTINLIKETNPQTIMAYGVMSTPAIVVDEQLLHSGSIPQRKDIEQWLSK